MLGSQSRASPGAVSVSNWLNITAQHITSGSSEATVTEEINTPRTRLRESLLLTSNSA